jgi:IclR family acetate operon transcriptional repressor
MTVKRIRGASRALEVLEAIAREQPVAVGQLSKILGEHKSTLQRVLMTLADDGWIRAAPGPMTRWELAPRIYTLMQTGQGNTEIRHRARAALDTLRARTGETVMLVVPDRGRLITIEALESNQVIRSAPYIGMIVPPRESAAGRAVLARMTPGQRFELLGAEPDDELTALLTEVAERGYSINEGAVVDGSTNVGGAIMGPNGAPVAAIVVSGPSERMPPAVQQAIGELVIETAERLSKVMPALL